MISIKKELTQKIDARVSPLVDIFLVHIYLLLSFITVSNAKEIVDVCQR